MKSAVINNAPWPQPFPLRLVGVALMLLVAVVIAGCSDDAEDRGMELASKSEAEQFKDWTAPAGDDFAAAMQAWDIAAASKSGHHPGWTFAAGIIKRLAESDDPQAQYHLAMLHFTGNGGVEFNHNKSADLLNASAEQGYPGAFAFMALMSERGDGSMFRVGDEVALESWEKAAAGKHCGALRRLARAYENGELGLAVDADKAAQYAAGLENCIKR